MKLKSVLMTITSFVILYASLMWCSNANSYTLSDLERRISTPIYARDIRIQTREVGEIVRLKRWINEDMSEIRIHYKIDEQVRNVSDDAPVKIEDAVVVKPINLK